MGEGVRSHCLNGVAYFKQKGVFGTGAPPRPCQHLSKIAVFVNER